MSATIIDPTGGDRAGAVATPAVSSVARLDGLRVGLLENGKRNAAGVLDALGSALADAVPVGQLVPFSKKDFAMPLSEEFLEEIAGSCDVVVIGVGDCGSCSAAAIADGIALEAAGIPSAVICTEAFVVTSQAMAKLKGRPDFPYLLTEHPIANLTAEQVGARGAGLVDRVRERLTAASLPAGAPA